jgi:hypothetical protein
LDFKWAQQLSNPKSLPLPLVARIIKTTMAILSKESTMTHKTLLNILLVLFANTIAVFILCGAAHAKPTSVIHRERHL